ncbi:hypothetical protein ILUMI_04239 [Ignelater luminosus]|uniref:Uncharacterized protein n=1 Tax=Ignelater luminosus TaxID=2038154 RepID=A0A8K0DK59_IGNLU|nr:hypothetical protein ILUMI_04239 [Ignelater luminosus]
MIQFCSTKTTNRDSYAYIADNRDAKIMLHFFVYSQEVKNIVTDIKTINESVLRTDHRLVKAEMKLWWDNQEEILVYTKLAVNRFKNPELKENYQEETNRSFKELKEINTEWDLKKMGTI